SWNSWKEVELTEEIKQADLNKYNSKQTDNLIYDYEELSYYYKTKAGIGVEPIEFDNVPTEGFVLNKKVGGTKSGWNHRSTYCRVYD
ncbi:hypothetical protein MK528_11220, partial [Streptococcus gordonii]|uniref:hypothetical protein n=1 Tax=Streptococcus gordonii TaxID=1302 RepID=UPI0022840824